MTPLGDDAPNKTVHVSPPIKILGRLCGEGREFSKAVAGLV